MGIPLICRKSLVYAGKRRAVGDPFDAHTESDARLLCAIGSAERPRAVPPAKKVLTASKAMPPIKTATRRSGSSKGTYSRRDMRAEDSAAAASPCQRRACSRATS